MWLFVSCSQVVLTRLAIATRLQTLHFTTTSGIRKSFFDSLPENLVLPCRSRLRFGQEPQNNRLSTIAAANPTYEDTALIQLDRKHGKR